VRGTSKAPPSRSKSKISNRLHARFGVLAALIAVLALALPAGASALAPGQIEEFTGATEPTNITSGPDGNLWFTDFTGTKVGRITPAGVITEYGGLSCPPIGIDAGPDGKIWFTQPSCGKIGRIDPLAGSPEASIEQFGEANGLPAGGQPFYITAGPDGNMWFTDTGKKQLGRITMVGAITEYGVANGLNATADPRAISAGSDGNVWFSDSSNPNEAIGKITPSGTITEYPVAGAAESIALGSDGNIWFIQEGEVELTERMAKITPSGTVTKITTPTGNFNIFSLAPGPDGNVWGVNVSTANEVQEVEIKADASLGGTYKLCFESECTAAINFNEITANVRSKLGALAKIGGNTNVTVGIGAGGAAGDLWTRKITFTGKFARTNVPLMTCATGELTGTNPTCTVKTTVEALAQKFVRVKPSGAITEFDALPATRLTEGVPAGALSAGPDGNLWFTASSTGKVGKFGVEVPKTEHKLTLTKEGTGNGTVVSSPAGIECGATCDAEFVEGTKVTLTASPDSESQFVSWKGCEAGGAVGRTCKVTMDKAKTVIAKFIQAYDVSVTRKGTGLGKVGSSPGGVLCLSNCSSTSAAFKELTNVTLTATPSKNSTFTGWSGDCAGTGTCVLSSLSADKAVEAEFTAVPQHLLTVTKSGGGNGTVKAAQAGINCGATCTSQASAYYQGTEVELTVTPGKGSSFGGWSTSAGTCTGTTNPCKVTISAAKAVTAEFK